MSTIDIMAFLHATEQAALRAGHATGLGDPDEARHLAIEGMHETLAPLPIDGRIVIGEGHIADGEKLFKSEEIGTGGPAVDIAASAIDGSSLVVKGQNGAVSAIAITGEGGVLHLPDIYMEKICVGPQAKGRIDLNLPVKKIFAASLKDCSGELTIYPSLSSIGRVMKTSSTNAALPAPGFVLFQTAILHQLSMLPLKAPVFMPSWESVGPSKVSLQQLP